MSKTVSDRQDDLPESEPNNRVSRILAGKTKRFLPRSVRGMLVLLLLVALVPILLADAELAYRMFEGRRAEVLQANLELSRAVALTFDSYIRYVLNEESVIGIALTSSQSLSEDKASRLLTTAANEHPSIRNFAWIDRKGRVVASSQSAAVGLDFSKRFGYEEIAAGREWVVSDLFQGRPDNDLRLVIARGVRDEIGWLQGAVIADVDPQRISEEIKVERSEEADIGIVDRRGRLVSLYPSIELTWEQRNWIETQPIINRALSGEEATDTIIDAIDGKKRLASFTPISSIGWVAVARSTEDNVTALPIQDLVRESGQHLIIVVVAFLVAMYISRYITIPMRRLREHAAAIGRGEFGRRAEVAWLSELDELANVFNRMSEEICVRQAQLNEVNQKLVADIGVRERVEAMLTETNLILQALIEASPVAITATDLEGNITIWSKAAERIFGWSESEVIGLPNPIVPKDRWGEFRSIQERLVRGEVLTGVETRRQRKDGSLIDISLSTSVVRDDKGNVSSAMAVIADITDRKRADEMLAKSHDFYLTLLNEFPNPIWRSDVNGRCDYFNKSWLTFTGRTMEQETGDGWTEDIHPEDLNQCLRTYAESFEARSPFEVEFRLRRHDGKYRWIVEVGRPIDDLDGNFAGYIASCYDITGRKQYEQQLAHMANHDPLTELPNRRYLKDALKRAIARANRGIESVLLYLDIDNFKVINDTLGHAAGDQALLSFVSLIRSNLRDEDLLVRVGGDEFAVLLEGMNTDDALVVAERLRQAVDDMIFTVDGRSFDLGLSVGLAPIDGEQPPEVVLRRADEAMYSAKALQGNQVFIHRIA